METELDFLKRQGEFLVFIEEQKAELPVQIPFDDFKRLVELSKNKQAT